MQRGLATIKPSVCLCLKRVGFDKTKALSEKKFTYDQKEVDYELSIEPKMNSVRCS